MKTEIVVYLRAKSCHYNNNGTVTVVFDVEPLPEKATKMIDHLLDDVFPHTRDEIETAIDKAFTTEVLLAAQIDKKYVEMGTIPKMIFKE